MELSKWRGPVTRCIHGIDFLSACIQANKHLFGRHKCRVSGNSPHRECEDIWIRAHPLAVGGDIDLKIVNEPHDSVWYPEADALPIVKNIIFDLMHQVRGEKLGGVLIMKLPPGGKIYPHIDHAWHALEYTKYFVNIHATKECVFHFEDGDMIAPPGEIWRFNNQVLHWLTNDSQDDWIFMVVCIKHERG